MKFTINFKSGDGKSEQGDGRPIASLPEEQIGLEGLDEIRAEKGSHILPKNISKRIESKNYFEITISVTEQKARVIGLFAKKNFIDIFVQNAFSEWFFEKCISQKYENGEYKEKYSFVWEYDYEKILDAWEKVGYPILWDVKGGKK